MRKPLIAYSLKDNTSVSIANKLFDIIDFEEIEPQNGMRRFKSDSAEAIELEGEHIFADFLTNYSADYIVFLSKHFSSKGIASFTTHAEGNWSSVADLGGKPHELSIASPDNMLKLLKQLNKYNHYGINVTYEATHHGPLLAIPSLFVEVGGNEAAISSENIVEVIANSVADLLLGTAETHYNKVAIGIGSTHYPRKFSLLALEKDYAFSHIMPRYYSSEISMLEQALNRSSIRAEIGVIEWKSINSEERNNIIKELENLGIDYERI
ncbi:MAG: D-aminoacyl-tRNA deacylase [Candidatus Micrarchaeaceae archaeon]